MTGIALVAGFLAGTAAGIVLATILLQRRLRRF